jgi:hypothetical protein
MAVAGNLNFSIVAEFEDGPTIIGYESVDDVEIVAGSLSIQDYCPLQACNLHASCNAEWRVLSWNSSFVAALKQVTVCARSQSGPGVKIGWIGAVGVAQDSPNDPAAAAAEHELNSVSASAVASKRIHSFACASENESCDIQCLWSQPCSRFFSFVDIYLAVPDAPVTIPECTKSQIWQGRSATGVFVISNVSLHFPVQVVFVGTSCSLQRVELARITVCAPCIQACSNHQ